jgi:hypothetical protein
MASLVYENFVNDLVNGAYDVATATYYVMLVTDAYVPNQLTDHYRQDVLNQAGAEVTGAAGYTPGGARAPCTATMNTALKQIQLTFVPPVYNSSSITARAAVLYHARGGSPNADELVAYADFGMDVTSSNGSFTTLFSTPLIFQL